MTKTDTTTRSLTQLTEAESLEVRDDSREDGDEGAAALVAGPSAPDTLTRRRDDRGMVSAEWAVGIIAAIAVAGVLLAVVTDGSVKDAILKFILAAINQFSGGFGKLW